MAGKALEGIKIADFTWAITGPLTTKYFGDHGATVIRIEARNRPDVTRVTTPFKALKPGVNRAAYFAYFNPNKYSMCLNLNHPRGIEVVKRLVAWSDIVVENFRPGLMEKWRLGYEDLKKIKPDIIMLSASNRGQTGPLANHGTMGVPIGGELGFSYLTGWPDRDMMPLPLAYLDSVTPRFAAAMLIAAILYRRRTGKGLCLDISQYETGPQFLAPVFLDYSVNGREAHRAGNSCACAAPHAAYLCKGEDKWCVIAVFTDAEWRNFCAVIGRPELANDARFATLALRKQNEAELNELVEQWTARRAPEKVMDLMQAAGVAAGVVADGERICQDEQLKSRGHFWPMRHPELGVFPHLGQPFKLSGTPAEARAPAPCMGEHTEYVCTEILGMSDSEFVDLLSAKVFD